MKKVLFIDTVHPLIREELTAMGYSCEEYPGYGRKEYEAIAGEYAGMIVRSKIRIDRDFLDRAGKLEFIGRVGSGLENIDVEYAAGLGVRCINSPEGNRDAVGEHAVGMLLNLFNHISRADRQVRQGQWIREGNRGMEILGKTIGIIGYGNTGSAFASKLRGFGATVMAYDKYRSEYGSETVRECVMDELFENTDVLSLHLPLTEETTGLVCSPFLSKFRKDIFIVNTSRGPIVRTTDLVEALKSGKVRGAALDVLEYEDNSFEQLQADLPPGFRYLLGSDRVILTPHIAGWTVESNIRLARVLVDKIRELAPGPR